MSHVLEALVADISVLHELAAEYKNAVVVNLGEQSMGLLPLTPSLLLEFDNSEFPYPEMIKLSKPLPEKVVALSKLAPIAYIQTEYWGGTGTQGSVVWHNGQVVLEPVLVDGIGTINTALQKLGVKAADAKDEFDTLGLGKFRHTSDWFREGERIFRMSLWLRYQLALVGGFLAMSAHVFLTFSRSAWFTPQHIGSTLASGLLFGHVVALMVLVARDLPLYLRGRWSTWVIRLLSIVGGIILGMLSWWVHITLTLLQSNPDWLTLLFGGIGLSFGFWLIPLFADFQRGATHYALARVAFFIVVTMVATFLPIYFAFQNYLATFNTLVQAQALLYFQVDDPEHVWLIGVPFALTIAVFGQLPMLFMTNSSHHAEP